ncbi:MAG: hypothetical protein IIC87_06370 [Chloroflexi bacterium]|nr:hypothetical protein [Chloroflexota bacterium]
MRPEWTEELEDIVARFRMGEAEVGRAFFERPRPLDQHARWLKFQITREARNLREISGDYLKNMVDRTDDTVTREELVDRVKEDYQELRHYGMLAYLYEGLTQETLKWQRLVAESQEADWFQFGHVLSEERIEAIIRGDIQPATQAMLVDASADIVEDHHWFGRFHDSAKPLSNASIAG